MSWFWQRGRKSGKTAEADLLSQLLTGVSVEDLLTSTFEKLASPRDIIKVDSKWKRDPPKRQIVRVECVFKVDHAANMGLAAEDEWWVGAVPVTGGKKLMVSAGWFLENFTNLETIKAAEQHD